MISLAYTEHIDSFHFKQLIMRNTLVFLTVFLSVVVFLDAYRLNAKRFDDEELADLARRFLQSTSDRLSMSRRKTQAGLQNPEILAYCQAECAWLRAGPTEPADRRKPYTTCRDDCVDEELQKQNQ